MQSIDRRFIALLLLLFALAGGAWGAGAPIPAAPERWATDTAGFLTPAQLRQLDAKLEAYQRQSGHQVVVWIGTTLDGAALDDWAVHTFAAWKLGRKGFDDGLALFILAADRKIDIEVGYGLEGVVPDAIANRIIQDVMAPKLRANDPDGAVRAGVDAILSAIDGTQGGALPTPLPVSEPAPRNSMPIVAIIGIGLFILLFIFNPRLALYLLWGLVNRGGGGGNGGSGGGFEGGGGRSGGGGARGSW